MLMKQSNFFQSVFSLIRYSYKINVESGSVEEINVVKYSLIEDYRSVKA